MNRNELEGMTVHELRGIGREKIAGNKTAIISLSKTDLIESIIEGKIVSSNNGNNGNGNGHGGLNLEQLIAQAVSPLLTPTINLDEIRDLARDIIKSELKEIPLPTRIIDPVTGDKKDVGHTHSKFERILGLAINRLPIWLVGPAGSGKSFLACQLAKSMGLPYYFQSVGPQTTKTDLLGYMDATGKYVSTHLRTAYEHGGVFLLDEIDAGNGAVLTVLNNMLENGHGSFPDKIVEKHKDFVIISAANTFGHGSDRIYVGRNQLDGATLERFIVINFEYDESLELKISGNKDWTKKVQKIRKVIFDLKERVICSPRASIRGSVLIELGWSEEDILDSLVFKGVSSEIKSRILGRL